MTCLDCGNPRAFGDWPFCPHGKPGPFWNGDAQIHASEKVVYYRNPQTGEVRIPGRADRPVHPKYLASGFTERTEVNSFTELRQLENRTGLIHEKSNYDDNSSASLKDTGSR